MPNADDLLSRRFDALGRNAPLFYDRPVHVVRGDGVWVEDADGRRYLDAYNNVPHVGHCHPRVVDAVARQAAELNLHTRYLHELVVEYAERLTAQLADPLDTAVFTCSGSEANELALRMARFGTGSAGVIVSDFSYHGNTATLASLTTCFPVVEAFPDFARKVTVPDPRHDGAGLTDAELADRYVDEVAAADTGLPPKVLKYVEASWKSETRALEATTPASGWPLPIGLPMVTMSGTTSLSWCPHIASPVRPNPACTSSQMKSPPASRTSSTPRAT